MYVLEAMDFAATGAFTRASTATYFDSAGVMQSAANDTARLSYDPADLTRPPAWLMEAAATNLATHSEDLTDVAWQKSDVTVTANAATSPTGAATMDKVVEAATTANHEVASSVATVTAGQPCTGSIFLKAAERTCAIVRLSSSNGTFSAVSVAVDLSTGQERDPAYLGGGAMSGDAEIVDVGGGIYRVELTGRLASDVTQVSVLVYLQRAEDASITFSYPGDGSSGLYAWGVQIEAGAAATSYIATVAAAVTRAADVNSYEMFSNVAESEAVYSGATTYALAARVRGNTSPTAHTVYESLVGSNTGNPLTDATKWAEVGATNRWSMFDDKVQSQTGNASVIAVQLAISGRVDKVALLNVSGAKARVVMTDAVEGVVYDETVSLTSTSGIIDWHAYWFDPIVRKTDVIFTDLPPYAGPAISVSILDTGETAACGVLVTGLARDLGGTQYGATLGIADYSVKQADDFGNYVIVERAFARTASFAVWVDHRSVDEGYRLLSTLRATPALYVGDEDYGASAVYGFFKDFRIEIPYPDVSVCTLELEGLA